MGDVAQPLPFQRALVLACVETVGLAVLASVYLLINARTMATGPLLFPLAVTFVLITATAGARGARPLRVLLSYAIAAGVGLGVSALPGPLFPEVLVGVFLALLLMHLLGVFHAPAVGVALVAVITNYSLSAALLSFAELMALTVLTLALAWLSNRLLGDAAYPEHWW